MVYCVLPHGVVVIGRIRMLPIIWQSSAGFICRTPPSAVLTVKQAKNFPPRLLTVRCSVKLFRRQKVLQNFMSMQELGGTKIEADRSLQESGTGKQNGGHLLATLFKAMEESWKIPKKL